MSGKALPGNGRLRAFPAHLPIVVFVVDAAAAAAAATAAVDVYVITNTTTIITITTGSGYQSLNNHFNWLFPYEPAALSLESCISLAEALVAFERSWSAGPVSGKQYVSVGVDVWIIMQNSELRQAYLNASQSRPAQPAQLT